MADGGHFRFGARIVLSRTTCSPHFLEGHCMGLKFLFNPCKSQIHSETNFLTITELRRKIAYIYSIFDLKVVQIIIIHSFHFYSASSSRPGLLLRSAPDTARILFRSLAPKRHRQLRVKDLPKVPTSGGSRTLCLGG